MSTDLFIRRPVLTTLLMAAILLFGIMGLPAAAGQRSAERRLPDDPGGGRAARARARRPWRSAVATPLEQQFTTIAGIDSMTSSSALGLTQITIQFSARPRTSTRPPRTCRR